MARWRLADAQKHLAKVVEKALSEGPQTISVTKGCTVIVSSSCGVRTTKTAARPKRKAGGPPTVAEALLAAPHVPEFRIPRAQDVPIAPRLGE